MNLNIAICDDDIQTAARLHEILEYYEIRYEHNLNIKLFDSGHALSDAYTEKGIFDLIFLGVEMHDMNGIDLAEDIRNMGDRDVNIIFISRYPEYMQRSFMVHPFYYMRKPIAQNQIFDIMSQLIKEALSSKKYIGFIDTFGDDTALLTKDIIYITIYDSSSKELLFHTAAEDVYARGTIRDWENKLLDLGFIKCRRDTLVNITAIHKITGSEIILTDSQRIPISYNTRQRLKKKYSNKIIEVRA